MTQIQVTKREGHREVLDLEKLHKAVFWATQGITGVSASEIEIKSHIQFYNGIKTADIQETLIKSAADLISEETPNYQYVAGRLICYHLRKQVYNSYTPWPLLTLVKRNVESGFYDASQFFFSVRRTTCYQRSQRKRQINFSNGTFGLT
jgi:ribonucleoside-diphosphate reductase alpha chain